MTRPHPPRCPGCGVPAAPDPLGWRCPCPCHETGADPVPTYYRPEGTPVHDKTVPVTEDP